MAFVVRRPEQRFEIRESESTPRGPRARTLASFVEISDAVLDLAQERARATLDRARLRARAIALGASVAPPLSQAAAHDLLRSLGRGERLPVAVRRVLRRALDESDAATDDTGGHLVAMLPWMGATDEDRAAALIDLLGVADAVPAPRRRALRYPRLDPR